MIKNIKNLRTILKLIVTILMYDYYEAWEKEEERKITKQYRKENRFNVFIPDKEYGDYFTWLKVIEYFINRKYESWNSWWNNKHIHGKIFQVAPEYFDASVTERWNTRKYLVGGFVYYFNAQETIIEPLHKPMNPELPILPKNEEIPIYQGKWCNNASAELNRDIIQIESVKQQLKGSYNRTLGRRLSGYGKLTREDLKHSIFNNDPIYQTIRDYKPLWNMYCSGIDKVAMINHPKLHSDGSDVRKGCNSNDLTVGGNINYYPDGLEKLPARTSSDRTFYHKFIPYYTLNYLGKNINTRREYKIAKYLFEDLDYYSSTLDDNGWYDKLYPRRKFKGEEGKALRKEVREWLKYKRK